jgi:hypothetical protein
MPIPEVPFGVTAPEEEGLQYLACEISYGGEWVDLNDHERYRIAAEGTRESSSKTYRKITAQSPVLGGSYLVHAAPEMVSEQINVWVHGNNQTDLADNYWFLNELFEQFEYRIRWTFNEYRETWRCQLADAQSARGHVWTHNHMALCSYTVPRFPDVSRERI